MPGSFYFAADPHEFLLASLRRPFVPVYYSPISGLCSLTENEASYPMLCFLSLLPGQMLSYFVTQLKSPWFVKHPSSYSGLSFQICLPFTTPWKEINSELDTTS